MTRFLLAALALAAALPTRAGVILEYQDGTNKRTTVELEGKRLRSFSQGEGGDRTTIFDGDRHVFYVLNDKEKSFQRMDEASAVDVGKRLSEAMEKAKARMTPEQRARMEAFLAKQQKPIAEKAPLKEHDWKFERATGGETVAGYACDNYRVLRDGALESEGCFVPWSAGVLTKDNLQAFAEMGRFFEKNFATMRESAGQGGRASPSRTWLTEFVETAPGFPAVMDNVDKDGKRTHEMRLVKLERASLSSGRFLPPADYRERPFGMSLAHH